MGIIDTHSDYSLYDVLDGTLELTKEGPEGTVEFCGFHITPAAMGGGTYVVMYDGHAGTVDRIESDEFDDVLELVDRLLTHVFEVHHYQNQGDMEGLVDYAGKMVTTQGNKRAQERPDLYMETPAYDPKEVDDE